MSLTQEEKDRILAEAEAEKAREEEAESAARLAYERDAAREPGWYWARFHWTPQSGWGIWAYSPPGDAFEDLVHQESYGRWSHPGVDYETSDMVPAEVGEKVSDLREVDQ